jgi:large subunit ribosomal protein L24
MNIKKGDNVKILSGKDRGKTGNILRVYPDKGRVLVEGLNTYKKNVRPKQQGQTGEIVTIQKSLNTSNVQLMCKKCNKGVRVGRRVENDKKVRYCKRCQATL